MGDVAWTIAIASSVVMVAAQLVYEYKESPRRKHKKK